MLRTALATAFALAVLAVESRFSGIAGIACVAGIVGNLIANPVSRCGLNFQFVQLIPFRVGAVAFRNGKQFANPAARIERYYQSRSRRLNCGCRRLNWREVGFVLQEIPDQSSKISIVNTTA